MSELSDGDRKIYDKIAKLLQLANKNPNAEEAASAAAKAQALLEQYNLDAALIDKAQGRVDGRREEMKVEGGFYKFQRDLYKAVAELNFCMYFTEEYYIKREKDTRRRDQYGGWKVRHAGTRKLKRRHRIIGRQVNTATTQAMASYLVQAIERLIHDRLRKSNGEVDHTQLLSRWATSFREGAAENIVERLREQQATNDRARRASAAKAARSAGAGKASTATGLTLSDVKKTEEAGNYDFLYGEGAWARAEQYAVEAAAERRREREEMARLAKENPEEFARLGKERSKGRRYSYGRSERERPKDWSAFNDGHAAGKSISIHRQADAAAPVAKLGK